MNDEMKRHFESFARHADPVLDNLAALKGEDWADAVRLQGQLIALANLLARTTRTSQLIVAGAVLELTQACAVALLGELFAKLRGAGDAEAIGHELLDDYKMLHTQLNRAKEENRDERG